MMRAYSELRRVVSAVVCVLRQMKENKVGLGDHLLRDQGGWTRVGVLSKNTQWVWVVLMTDVSVHWSAVSFRLYWMSKVSSEFKDMQ